MESGATFCCPESPATTPSDEAWSRKTRLVFLTRLAMLLAVPLALAADLQPRAVDDEGDGSGWKASNGIIDLERLVASAEGAPG